MPNTLLNNLNKLGECMDNLLGKIRAGLKMLPSDQYNFYLNIEEVSIKEFRSTNRISLRKKNNKGIKIKAELILGNKVNDVLETKNQKFKKGHLTSIANNQQHFSLSFDIKIPKGRLKREGTLYKLQLQDEVSGYYKIEIEYIFTEEMLRKVDKDYYSSRLKNEVYEVKKERVIVTDEEKLKKDIGVKNTKSSYKNCTACDFYKKGGKCGLFSIKVSSNNICKRFYKTRYKVVYGGAFSPR